MNFGKPLYIHFLFSIVDSGTLYNWFWDKFWCVYSGLVVVSSHQQAICWTSTWVLQFKPVLVLSTWIWHQIPQVKGSVLPMLARGPGCYLYFFWLTNYKSKVLKTSSLGLINLLEQLKKTGKTCLLTRVLSSPIEEKYRARYLEGHRASMPSSGMPLSASPHIDPTEKLSKNFWVWWRLDYISMID